MMSVISKNKNGFTLIELSIVIVIVGLIIAGVSSGQSLVRNYGLRRVITDMQNLQSAANTFKLQYNQYPGDFNNAYAYWGSNCAASTTACNGNGNGQILSGQASFKEELMSFNHLSLAGLLPGAYTGTIGSGLAAGVNLPAGPFSNSGYSIAYEGTSSYVEGNWNSPWDANSYGNFIWFGASASDIMRSSIITPKEMYSIDIKLDDGLPHSGKILAALKNNCSVSTTAPTTYAVTTSSKSCAMKYRL